MTRQLPLAARRIMRDAIADAQDAGVRDPLVLTEEAARALLAHGWAITAHRAPDAPQAGAQTAA